MAEGHSDIDIVVNIFKKLRTVDETSTFCKNLTASLPQESQRDLKSHLAEVHFKQDPIERVPLEISCLIFQHLDIYQAFQLRRVSKLWLRRLSAPDFVESLLRPWFAMGEVNLRMPPNISAEAALSIKAEHVDAYKTGNPFSMLRGTWEWDSTGQDLKDLSKIVYKHGHLAWLDADDTAIRVRNLELGHQSLYTLPNREKANLIALSSDIIAATTLHGRCYAWDRTTGAPSSIKLPSSWNLGLFVSGKSLAIVHSWGDPKDMIYITTWNLYDGTNYSFCIRSQGQPRDRKSGCGFNVHMKTGSLVFLQRRRGPPDEIFFTHRTLDGKSIAEGTSGPLGRTFRSGYVDLASWPQQEPLTLELEELDRVTINQEEGKFRGLRDYVTMATRGIFRPVYDVRTDRFVTPWDIARSCREFDHRGEIGNNGNYWFCWKDTAFRFYQDNDDRCRSTAVLNLQTGAFRETCMRVLDSRLSSGKAEGWEWQNRRRLVGEPLMRRRILHIGDEIYMVRIYPAGFTAFCFDKNITMAGDNNDFRKWREDLQIERIKRTKRHDSSDPKIWDDEPLSITQKEQQLTEHEREMFSRAGHAHEDG
ncbi:MAG: hypothetical protein LQ350_003904 [Teloschistes chrysophthalmus]|nr:MAG: hypothetical protein LQ350_003904 [Niorma chrysophthalma]